MTQQRYTRREVPRDAVSTLPDSCGVYLFKDREGDIIYVGKAKSIVKRVKSHILRRANVVSRVEMSGEISTIDYILTRDEHEALLLEEKLIKGHSPRFNLRLKDDKSYPYIRLDMEDRYPAIHFARRKTSPTGRFFGPLTDAGKAREGIKLLRTLFLLRGCRIPEKRFPLERHCLDYEIGLCCAPCTGRITPEKYRHLVRKARTFLEGNFEKVETWLEKEMWNAARTMNYENAATLRDRLETVRKISARHRLVLPENEDVDFVEVCVQEGLAGIVVMKVRRGRLVGSESFFAQGDVHIDRRATLVEFLGSFFSENIGLPERVCTTVGDISSLARILGEEGIDITLTSPLIPAERDMCNFALENAEKNLLSELSRIRKKEMEKQSLLSSLAEFLELPSLPVLVEGVDISTFQGEDSVGVVVAFRDGEPLKNRYRKFIVRLPSSTDDTGMMAEVVKRHVLKLKKENKELPHLLLVDGGKGQLSAALEGVEAADLFLPVVAIAKECEELYLPGRSRPVRLPPHSPVLRFFQRVRNESHRFAVGFHRRRRNARLFHSLFEEVKGIGPIRKKRLMEGFSDLSSIQEEDPLHTSKRLGIPLRVIEKLQEKMKE